MPDKKINKPELADEDLDKVIGGPGGEGDGDDPPYGQPPGWP